MQPALLIFLSLIALLIFLLVVALWHRWSFYLHIGDGKFLLELRGFGFRRRLIYRDLKSPPAPKARPTATPSPDASGSDQKKKSKFSFKDRFDKEKKRIYDPEKGGYQPGGLKEVWGEYQQTFEDFKDIILGFAGGVRQKIWITSLLIRLDYGTGDPAHTGMLYGSIWSGIGIAYPILCRYIRAVYPTLEITPDFYGVRFDLEIKSIIKVRPAHIIHALLKQLWRPAITYCYNHFTRKGSVAND